VALPQLDGSKNSSVAEDGTVVFSTDESTDLAVQPTDRGVQIMSVLRDASAPSSFDYDLSLPTGALLSMSDDGGAVITGSDGSPLATVAAPWAADANGRSVPTHYTVVDGTLTQVVDRTAGDFSYPIVADPSILWWVVTIALCAAEIIPIVSPAVTVKIGLVLTKAGSIIAKSTKLAAAIDKLGGLKPAITALTKFAVNKGAGLTAAAVALVKIVWLLGVQTIFDLLGIGDCGSLLLQLI
jgi:hypothetical protein